MAKINSGKIPYLDGWRGLAIISVLLAHFGNLRTEWLGLFGILLFFVLSGHFMSQLLYGREISLSTFFVRRVSRVLPTLFVFLVAMAFYAAFFYPVLYKVPLTEFAATIAFLRTYWPSTVNIWASQWPIGHIWSLNVEEHSYIFLALVALMARHTGMRHCALLALGVSTALILGLTLYTGINPPLSSDPYWMNWRVKTQFAALPLIASAGFFVLRSTFPDLHNPRATYPIFAFLIAIICSQVSVVYELWLTLASLALAYSLAYFDHVPDVLKRCMATPIIRWFGQCSFSLYLWQQPFHLLAAKFKVGHPMVFLALALASGALSYYFLEAPLRRRINNAWNNRLRVRTAAAVQT
jgi:peptidoglycan/LPS O-acetylase OafA/YrhL